MSNEEKVSVSEVMDEIIKLTSRLNKIQVGNLAGINKYDTPFLRNEALSELYDIKDAVNKSDEVVAKFSDSDRIFINYLKRPLIERIAACVFNLSSKNFE